MGYYVAGECVIFIKKVQKSKNKILCSDAPSLANDIDTLDLAKEFNKNLMKSLKCIKEHPHFNYITISLPERLIFNDLFLKNTFGEINKTYSKRFLKKKIKFMINNKLFVKKIQLIMTGHWAKYEKKINKKGK